MKILIVSGFLGAGKTTFIKEMIRRTGKQFAVLENEYGESSLDANDIGNAGDLEVLEFMEGCVCCTKKDSFANTILAISASLDPEYLVVEPTGIGKLGSILSNLDKIKHDRIEVLPPVMVLSPSSFVTYQQKYPDIFLDQVRHAGKIVFSKAEHTDGAELAALCDVIRKENPGVRICPQPYQAETEEFWEGLFFMDGEVPVPAELSPSDDPTFQRLTIRKTNITGIGEFICFLEDALRGVFGPIVRAKGVLQVGEEWMRFDLADGLYGIIAENGEAPSCECVFIGEVLREDKLRKRLAPNEAAARHKKFLLGT